MSLVADELVEFDKIFLFQAGESQRQSGYAFDDICLLSRVHAETLLAHAINRQVFSLLLGVKHLDGAYDLFAALCELEPDVSLHIKVTDQLFRSLV